VSDATAVVRKFFDALNAADLDQVAALSNEEIAFIDVAFSEEIGGRAAWRAYCERYTTGFSDLRIELTNLFGAGDWVFAEAVGRGTNDGPLVSPGGEIPATGRRIEVRFGMVFRVEGGQIAESREYYDAMTFLTQLGLMPGPG
jgi:steroid delta-isomerase-like uncharacterized protein